MNVKVPEGKVLEEVAYMTKRGAVYGGTAGRNDTPLYRIVAAKQECQACGANDYSGELRECPHCGRTKCSRCDMGNNVGCAVCDNEE